MARPRSHEYPVFYGRYVDLVQEEAPKRLLDGAELELEGQLAGIPEALMGHRYAEGKWAVAQLLQHMIDTERIFGYRALCFARGETQALPGFDEQAFAAAAEAVDRSAEDIKREFLAVRRSTVLLYGSFDARMWSGKGIASGGSVTVAALLYMTVGHARHHFRILRERYGLSDIPTFR